MKLSGKRTFVLCATLFLLGCGSMPATDGKRAESSAATLVRTSWVAQDIDGRGVLDQVQSTITFESETRVVGSTGCNQYFAPLKISPPNIGIGRGGSTRRACPPPVMDQENRFLAALEAARSYRMKDRVLELLDDSGRVVVRLMRTQGSAERSDRSPEKTLAAYAFDCASGPSFVLKPIGAAMADFVLPEGTRRLTRERTASGAKYSDKQGYVWNKGRDATLEVGGRNYQCVEDRARSIREDARARGVEFRGTGNEPGWVLEIVRDRIIFTGNYGAERTVTPRPDANNDPSSGATLYTAVTEAHKLEARIEKRECSDSMNGERFEARVEVQLDGRIYRGCGYTP